MPDLSNLADQAGDRPGLIASHLRFYQRRHQISDAELARRLHCDVSDLTRLRLCRFPRSEHFDEDVTRIADHVHVDVAVLAGILRSVKSARKRFLRFRLLTD
jgi:hypothetical protein